MHEPQTATTAQHIADIVLAMKSPREAATALGYAHARLLAEITRTEAEARAMMADTSQGVITYWSALTGIKLKQ